MTSQDKAFVKGTLPFFRYRARMRVLGWFCWIFAVVLFVGFIGNDDKYSGIAAILMILALVLGVATGFARMIANDNINDKVWKVFGKAYDVQERYVSNTTGIPDPECVLGRIGDSSYTPVYAGTLHGWEFVAYSVLVRRLYKSRSNDIYNYRLLEIKTKQSFANVYLDSRENNPRVWRRGSMNYLRSCVDGNQQLHVEGDVNKYFEIYVPKGQHIEGLAALTPDTMLALRDHLKHYDVEFRQNKIYVIAPEDFKNPAEIVAYQASVLELLTDLGENLFRIKKPEGKLLSISTAGAGLDRELPLHPRIK